MLVVLRPDAGHAAQTFREHLEGVLRRAPHGVEDLADELVGHLSWKRSLIELRENIVGCRRHKGSSSLSACSWTPNPGVVALRERSQPSRW